jgi:GT2 family glycosyltransferase
MRALDVLVLTHERQMYFEKTLESLTSQRAKFDLRIHVIDNASGEEFKTCLSDHQADGDIQTVIYNEKNEGVPAFNKLLHLAQTDSFLMTDPDIQGPENWLEDLLKVWDERHKELNLAKLSVNLSGHNCRQKWAHFAINDPIKSEKVPRGNVTLSYVGTWLALFDKESMRRIGRYDQDNSHYDDAARLGYKVGFATNVVATHLGFDDWRDYPQFLMGKSTGKLCPGLENRPEVEYIPEEIKKEFYKKHESN